MELVFFMKSEIPQKTTSGLKIGPQSTTHLFYFQESGLEAHQFYPLVQLGCSDDMQAFLCSLYTPVCMPDYPKFLPPCRFLCERARDGCLPIMKEYGFEVKWKNKYLKIPHWGHSRCVGVIRFLSGPKKWIATFFPRRSPATISTGANWNRRKIRGQKRPSHKCAKTANAAQNL